MLKQAAVMVATLLAMLAIGSASAEPIDTWEITPGYDCVADLYNPILEDGTRDLNGDPLPATAEWDAREEEHTACTDQRDHDARLQPWRNVGTALYGEDMYRQPERWNNIRFHNEEFPLYGIPGVPSAEVYRPCSNAPGDCPNLPPELKRYDPPYPVVVVFHGIIAQYSHHRFITQAFAERGYMAVGVNGTIPIGSGPNSQRTANGNDVLVWLGSPASGIYGQQADLSRVGFAGHSQGGAATQSYQGDPRVHAMIVYDAGDAVTAANVAQPTMFQRTDGGFATPNTHDNYPTDRLRALSGYNALKSRNVDVFNFTARATVHTDWNGYGVGLAGNRLIELLINYYGLAWFDRHLKGRLVHDAEGNVVTSGGRTETEERAYRQLQAKDAFDRLIARYFDDSADVHNISMGFWDPELAVSSGDPLYGGNVPYQIAGLEARDRFSPYYQSLCSLSLPNYIAGGTGRPDDPVAPMRQADTTANGDMRFIGCPEISVAPIDSDGDGIPDDVDQCPTEPGPASNNGCPLPPADTTPDAFSFTSVSGVSQGAVVTSNVVSISGIDAPSPISVTTGEYRINGGSWTSAPGQITNGQTVQVRHTSAATANTVTETTLTIGGVSGKFRSTTGVGGDTDPNAFGFETQNGVATSSWIVSNTIMPVGYDAATSVKAGSGTQYSLGCTQDNWTSDPGTISPQTSICVRHTSAATANTLRKTSLQIGKTVGYFSTRTAP